MKSEPNYQKKKQNGNPFQVIFSIFLYFHHFKLLWKSQKEIRVLKPITIYSWHVKKKKRKKKKNSYSNAKISGLMGWKGRVTCECWWLSFFFFFFFFFFCSLLWWPAFKSSIDFLFQCHLPQWVQRHPFALLLPRPPRPLQSTNHSSWSGISKQHNDTWTLGVAKNQWLKTSALTCLQISRFSLFSSSTSLCSTTAEPDLGDYSPATWNLTFG